jgi:peptidoglycan hydrolase-like protein with peptidoglycan-binding domain
MRQEILSRAATKLGNPDPDEFWAETLKTFKPGNQKGLHWCGAYALWALRPYCKRMWRLGLGFLELPPVFPKVPLISAQPADILYWDAPYQHHAIFERLDGAYICSIDGNQGAPETCRRKRRLLVPTDYVQRALNTFKPPAGPLKDDGIPGPKTRAALAWFQTQAGLPANSEPDSATIKALGLKPTVIVYSIAQLGGA